MALIDVVKYNGNDKDFVWKFPSEDLRLGTQLIVDLAQTAFFVKSGKIYDEFSNGRYTLSSGNIPLLNNLINLPFGGNSPFASEVWYVNLISKLDNKWGTVTPIQIEDPEYGVIVPVRAFGQFGMKISEPRKFLETIVGTAKLYSSDKIVEYFTGKILSSTQSLILKKIIKDKVSVLAVSMYLDELSKFCEDAMKGEFAKFGIEILNYYIISINIPEADPSVIKLKEAKELAMKVKTVGKDIYQMERSFNVLEKAAENEGNAGAFMGAGMGLGMGMGVGANFGNQMGNISNKMNTGSQNNEEVPPPIISKKSNEVQYFVHLKNEKKGGFNIQEMEKMIHDREMSESTLVWTKGMADWAKLESIPELKSIIDNVPPPIGMM